MSHSGRSVSAATPRSTLETGRLAAAAAGVLAVASAVGVSELVAGLLRGVPSLVVAVGGVVVDNVPGAVERAAISVLGRNDKPVLLATILVACAVFGAALGVVASRRFTLGAAGFVGFAVVATAAALTDPQADTLPTVAVGLLAALTGVTALRLLLTAAAPSSERSAHGTGVTRPRAIGAGTAAPAPRSDSDEAVYVGSAGPSVRGTDRRAFLRAAGAAVAVSVIGAVGGRMLAARERVTAARASVRIPAAFRTAPPAPTTAALDVPGLTPLYISNANFYRIDTALTIPQVDPASWSLQVRGLVDAPFTLTYDELMAMDQVEIDVTLSCVSNEVGGDLVGNARWQGVLLKDLLDRAGVQPGATQIVGRSVDGFTAGFPTDIGLDGRDAIVAVAMNGEPLPVAHGFPARLVIPGLYGYVSATKWLSEIELTTWEALDGYWIPRGWSKLGPIKTQSRIDVPVGGTTIPAGPRAIAGIAWAPTRGVSAVEVKIDGDDWQEASLADALGVDSWRQWVYRWDATPGVHVIAVRATDGTGETQTDLYAPPAPDGASGYHTIQLTVEA